MNEVFIQAGYYGIVMLLSLTLAGFIQRGFFWKFIKVRISFGKLIMVKLRAVNRDYYKVGHIEEEFLVFKSKDGERRIPIPDSSYFYRSIGVTFIDVDDKNSALCKPDYTTAGTFDAEKYDNLYKRTLMRPQLNDKMQKALIIIAIVGALAAIVAAGLAYKIMANQQIIIAGLDALKKGVVLGSGGV